MTFNGAIALILRYFTDFAIALQADYVRMVKQVEDRPLMSA